MSKFTNIGLITQVLLPAPAHVIYVAAFSDRDYEAMPAAPAPQNVFQIVVVFAVADTRLRLLIHHLLHTMEQLQRNQRFVAALILVTVEAYVADGVTVAEHPGFAAASGCTHSPLAAGATSTDRQVVPLN
jgi:hypothetical protein